VFIPLSLEFKTFSVTFSVATAKHYTSPGATAQLELRPSLSFFMFLDLSLSLSHTHTQTHGRTPLDERSARRRGYYLHNTQQIQETNTHSLSGIRTRDPSNQAAWPPGLPMSQHIPYITCRRAKLYSLREGIYSELFYEVSHFYTKTTNKFLAIIIRNPYKFEATYFSCHRETNFNKVACLLSPIFRLQKRHYTVL